MRRIKLRAKPKYENSFCYKPTENESNVFQLLVLKMQLFLLVQKTFHTTESSFELEGIFVTFLLSLILLQPSTDKEDDKLMGYEEKEVRYKTHNPKRIDNQQPTPTTHNYETK